MAEQAPSSGTDPKPQKAKAPSVGGRVVLRERFEIDAGQPLPDLNMPQADAFVCEDRRGAGRSLYALVCRHDLPVRIGAMRTLKGVQVPGALQLVEYGIVEWKPAGRRLLAVVYERPAGGRVCPKPGGRFVPIPETKFAQKVLKPLAAALTEFSSRGVIHRAIRLDNLYWFDTNQERLVLGDCTTSPAGFDNPAVYEPLQMAMANPEGRGQGYAKDDLYALGMAGICLLNGRDLFFGMKRDEVIRAKLTSSTYAAFASEQRVPLNLIEVMRGCLCDEYKERWDLEALDLWLNGRRMSPIQSKPPKRAQRGIKFEGQEYFSNRELAHALAGSWDAGLAIVLEGKVEIWLRRGMEDNDTADAIALAIRMSQAVQGDPRITSDVTMARVLMLLDPAAPLRLRDLRVTLDGFGTALAVANMRKKPLRPYVEALGRDLPKHWVDAQGSFSAELGHYEGQFKDLAGNLSTAMIGWGIERCLYELNDYLHCQSPLIEEEYVSDIRELLPALDRVAARIDPKTPIIDRHIAAFIGVKWKRDTKVQFRALNEGTPERKTLGMVSLLAVLQWRLGPPALHDLCAWVGAQLGPVTESFHSRARRKELEKEIPRLIRKGSLPELYNLLDNQEERQKDSHGYAWARAEYSAAEQQVQAFEQGRLIRDEKAEATGRQAAAVMSMMIAVLTLCVTLFMRIW